MPEKPLPPNTEPPPEPRSFKPGEAGAYQTDAFSTNDREGRPPEDEAEPERPRGASEADAQPGRDLKATDDADSRDATPPSADGGGVR